MGITRSVSAATVDGLDAEKRLRELADDLGCVLEDDVQHLALYGDTTLTNLRRRGKGPAYILFGNRFLYPKKELAEYLRGQIRERQCALGAGDVL